LLILLDIQEMLPMLAIKVWR